MLEPSAVVRPNLELVIQPSQLRRCTPYLNMSAIVLLTLQCTDLPHYSAPQITTVRHQRKQFLYLIKSHRMTLRMILELRESVVELQNLDS